MSFLFNFLIFVIALMILETFRQFDDFALLDSGSGYRLERWGHAVLARPDPQAIWRQHLPAKDWENAHAVFAQAGGDRGTWKIKKPLPDPWIVAFRGARFKLKLAPFKHTGLFAEQAAQWEWMLQKVQNVKFKMQSERPILRSALKILNLFGYTGGATMVLAGAGCQVTHVDASRPAMSWAGENAALNNLPGDAVRWILDDAAKFVKREIRRGARYDGIVMDPPAFGHSPSGKTWKFADDLPELLADCVKILSPDARFLLVNAYATNSSALALNNIMEDALGADGRIEAGELCLKQTDGRMLSTGIFARWNRE